jgi:hypothetical protein
MQNNHEIPGSRPAALPRNDVAVTLSGHPPYEHYGTARSVIRVSSDGRPSRKAKPGHKAVPLFT